MILPEVNPEHTKVIEAQKKRLGTTRGFILLLPTVLFRVMQISFLQLSKS